MRSCPSFGCVLLHAVGSAEDDDSPASHMIMSRWHRLRRLAHHEHLCPYVDVQVHDHHRVYVVAQHYDMDLVTMINDELKFVTDHLSSISKQLCAAVHAVHSTLHTCVARLSIHDVLVDQSASRADQSPRIILTNYGLAHLTENGRLVSIKLSDVYHTAPELMRFDDGNGGTRIGDVWAVGCVLLQAILGCTFDSIFTPREFVRLIRRLSRDGGDVADGLTEEITSRCGAVHDRLAHVDAEVLSLVRQCLQAMPSKRLRNFEKYAVHPTAGKLFDMERKVDCKLTIEQMKERVSKTVSSRPIAETYALWKLAGSSVHNILRKAGIVTDTPPVLTLPDLLQSEHAPPSTTEHGVSTLRVIPLSNTHLVSRLPKLTHYYSHELEGLPAQHSDLSVRVRERDIHYQFARHLVYHRHLLSPTFSTCKQSIRSLAADDIPPLYRSYVWACLLDVRLHDQGHLGDTVSAHESDRQMDVDIPRCHQYDQLMSSPLAHAQLKHVIKLWLINHTQYVYWQGLDSLTAPFVYAFIDQPAVAFKCLSSFIDRYNHKLFLKENSAVMEEYLFVFFRLLLFHDPQLYAHLDDIGFSPHLFAIPWFLTAFAHVLPLGQLQHVWDRLLLHCSGYVFCFAVAVLVHMRALLVTYNFNDCIVHFSDLPGISIDECIALADQLYARTPPSIWHREHASEFDSRLHDDVDRHVGYCRFHPDYQVDYPRLAEHVTHVSLDLRPLALSQLKEYTCARLSLRDFLRVRRQQLTEERLTKNEWGAMICIDVRPSHSPCTYSPCIRIPYDKCPSTSSSTPLTYASLPPCSAIDVLRRHCADRPLIVIIDQVTPKAAIHLASVLIAEGHERVCILDGGIDALYHCHVTQS